MYICIYVIFWREQENGTLNVESGVVFFLCLLVQDQDCKLYMFKSSYEE